MYRTPILTLFHLYINSKTLWNHFGQKKNCQFFSNRKLSLINYFQFQLATKNAIQYVTAFGVNITIPTN